MSHTLSLSKQLQSCSHVEPDEASEAWTARRHWDNAVCYRAPRVDQYGRPVECINGYTCKGQGGCLEAAWTISRENRVCRPPVEDYEDITSCVCTDNKYNGFNGGINKAVQNKSYSYF